MISFCPKCRAFYADELLQFCLTDGAPLVKVNESSELWTEGIDSLNATKRKIERAISRDNIKKFLSYMVTTIVTALIVCVVAINSWIYIKPPPKSDERASSLPPSFDEPTGVSPLPPVSEPPIEPESTIMPAPQETPGDGETPSPTVKLKPATNPIFSPETPPPDETLPPVETTTPVKTSTPVETSTPEEISPPPHPTSTTPPTTTPPTTPPLPPVTTTTTTKPQMPTLPPEVCSSDIRKSEKNKIINSYGNEWIAAMMNQRDKIFRVIPRESQQSAMVTPLGNPFINVSIDKKSCQRASVFITQVWMVQYVTLVERRIERQVDTQAPAGRQTRTEIQRSTVRRSETLTSAQNFRCEKNGGTWICR